MNLVNGTNSLRQVTEKNYDTCLILIKEMDLSLKYGSTKDIWGGGRGQWFEPGSRHFAFRDFVSLASMSQYSQKIELLKQPTKQNEGNLHVHHHVVNIE